MGSPETSSGTGVRPEWTPGNRNSERRNPYTGTPAGSRERLVHFGFGSFPPAQRRRLPADQNSIARAVNELGR